MYGYYTSYLFLLLLRKGLNGSQKYDTSNGKSGKKNTGVLGY